MHKLTALVLTLTVIVGASALAGCGDDKPSASDWAAKVVKVCKGIETDWSADAAALPSDAAPTVEQLMAFYAAFGPKFASAVSEIKALDRPDGMAAAINELIAALDAAAARTTRGAIDAAVAEEDINSQDGAPEWARLEAASVAAGVDQCNNR